MNGLNDNRKSEETISRISFSQLCFFKLAHLYKQYNAGSVNVYYVNLTLKAFTFKLKCIQSFCFMSAFE